SSSTTRATLRNMSWLSNAIHSVIDAHEAFVTAPFKLTAAAFKDTPLGHVMAQIAKHSSPSEQFEDVKKVGEAIWAIDKAFYSAWFNPVHISSSDGLEFSLSNSTKDILPEELHDAGDLIADIGIKTTLTL